jgi:hypothetical protein
MATQNDVTSSLDFLEAVNKFQEYKPVKVDRDLKDEFHTAITNHFISMKIHEWSMKIYPLKKSYKFQRTKN